MKANVVLLVLYYWFHNAVAQKGLQCFVPGECLDSQILGATPTNNSRECWRHCQSTTGCTWFTFYKDSQVCTPLSGCLRLSKEKCQDNCVSGEEECPEVQCGVPGRCYGALEGIRKVANAKECATICRHHEECFWNTYDPEHESCLMTNDCPLLDRSCSNCSSSERDCITKTDILNEKNPKSRPSLLYGNDRNLKHHYFNVETKKSGECESMSWGESDQFQLIQYSAVGTDLLGCNEMASGSYIFCKKYDTERKIWVGKSVLPPNTGSPIFLSIFNRGIVILRKSKYVHFYNGMKIKRVPGRLPFTFSVDDGLCHTVISIDEILISFPEPDNQKLLSLNLTTGAYNFFNLPNLTVKSYVCEAFGPEGNRKVAIFNGYYLINGKIGRPFDRTLIFDWNTKTFEADGPRLKIGNSDLIQTLPYRDTFLWNIRRKNGSSIYKFVINGTETPTPYLGTIKSSCFSLAEIPSDIVNCK